MPLNLHVSEATVVMLLLLLLLHHLMLLLLLLLGSSSDSLNLRLHYSANDRRGRSHLNRPARNNSRRRSVSNDRLLLRVDYGHSLLMNVLQMGLEVGLLLELFRTNVARVFVVALTMDANHVSAQTALALELLEADVTVKSRSVMLGLHVHVSAAG